MRVLAVTGASGGHIFPALSFLDALKDKHKEIGTLLVLPKRSIKAQDIAASYEVKYLSTSTIGLSFNFKNLIAIFNFLKGIFESLFILVEFKPDIVVGFGGIDSIPLLLLAWALRIKTLIHEQNVIPGRANRLLAKFADKTAISFPETRNYYKIPQERIVLTGNPLRRGLKKIDKAEALSFFGLNSDKFTILVMGGSQGSRRINRALLRAVSLMPDKSKFQVIHIAGENEFGLLNQGYKDSLVKFKLFTFLNQMQYAYSGADLAICRAGATTISELIFYRLPAIIIPYPFAYKHQLSNAKVLERMQSALVIDDSELDTVILNMILDEIVKNPKKIDVMRSRFRGILKTEASNLLVDEALSLV